MSTHSDGETPGFFNPGNPGNSRNPRHPAGPEHPSRGGERGAERGVHRAGYKRVILSDEESQDFDALMAVFEVPEEHILDFGDGPSGVYSS